MPSGARTERDVVVVTDTDLGATDIETATLGRAGFDVRVAQCRTEGDVIEAGGDAVGLLVQYAPVTAAVLSQLPRLRAVVRYGTGLDPVDLDGARSAGVAVSGVDGYCVDEVADHTMALVLGVTRAVVAASSRTAAGEWPPAPAFAHALALRGRRFGVVGCGRIGRAVVERALAFGADVVVHDPALGDDDALRDGVRVVGLMDAFASDVVSVHVPLTPDTRGFVNASLLSQMRPGSVLVNVSRGGLVDERDLLASLEAGRPAFAALDVRASEPPDADDALLRHPGVVTTPHLGYYSQASLERLRRLASERLVELLTVHPSSPGGHQHGVTGTAAGRRA